MSNSTPILPQMSSSQGSKEVTFNNAIASVSPGALFGRNDLTTTGLTWGYFGGMGNAGAVVNGTIALTASTTNYFVTNRTTDAVSVATNTTNWNDTTTYRRLYSIVTGASTVTSWIDFRNPYESSTGGGSGTPGGSTTQVQYNSAGAFAGNANFTYDATNNVLTFGASASKIDSGTNSLDVHSVDRPAGGLLSVATGGTGAIKIALPTALYSLDFSVKLRLELFDSADNKSCTVLISAAYVGSTHIWSTAESIQIIGTDATVDYAVRLGSDGAAPCLWLAELASTWGVLRAQVAEAMFTGFAADQVVGIAASGWALSVVTSFGTVNATVTDNLAYPSAAGVVAAIAARRVVTLASTTSQAGVNFPPGAAPTTPVNGDMWSTSAGFFARVNGVTVGPFGPGGGAAGPAFSAYASAATSLISGANTKVLLGTEIYDTDGYFASSRFTPLIAGKYTFIGRVELSGTAPATAAVLYKNGVPCNNGLTTSTGSSSVTADVEMNGSTDYVELYCYQSGVTQNSIATSASTYFQGHYVRA